MSNGHDHNFLLSDLDFDLPEGLIAQQPPDRRDAARLLVVDRSTGDIADKAIADLPSLLAPGDLLVLNDTKVIPAKFLARRVTGGAVPGLFVSEKSPGVWRVMLQGSRRLRIGETLTAAGRDGSPVRLSLTESLGDGHWFVRLDTEEDAEAVLGRIGFAPLPPYIRREGGDGATDDRSRYQTVFAKRPGAIAAPTAGLHFTRELLDQIERRGVARTHVTLHVGLGTFKPVSAERLVDHDMHSEWYELSKGSAEALRSCRKRGGRIVAVGTTSVRVLESAAVGDDCLVEAGSGDTNIFIYPPYTFRSIDCLLTNFHLPRSTLLALVMAFAGERLAREAYRHAIDHRYRFYSYGDAMLIL